MLLWAYFEWCYQNWKPSTILLLQGSPDTSPLLLLSISGFPEVGCWRTGREARTLFVYHQARHGAVCQWITERSERGEMQQSSHRVFDTSQQGYALPRTEWWRYLIKPWRQSSGAEPVDSQWKFHVIRGIVLVIEKEDRRIGFKLWSPNSALTWYKWGYVALAGR